MAQKGLVQKAESKKWGIRSILATAIFTILGFIAGSFYSDLLKKDTQDTYYCQLITNAVSEIDHNLGISWYNESKFIKTTHYFPALRIDALWVVYYNSNRIFADKASRDNVKKCLDECDWINRLVPSQYTFENVAGFFIAKSDMDLPQEELEKKYGDKVKPEIYEIHKEMQKQYSSSVKPRLQQIKGYLETVQKDICN